MRSKGQYLISENEYNVSALTLSIKNK